ncbi:hypothetical protein PS862_05255 [Pseudomonas fluorescens]|uniref:Phosphotyrosine protein phosphatase I domain-containing protein n=1 Tax=Pseudomonas fluorescens TaxID=294 RepID=A0A5E6QLT6_PSEFL|nr:hypothetical protein PS639_01045 [Pseudomonas fluorescens]VVP48357.1 hypothetical protein PS862_05255 [Pseudomonas fluorescens]
MNTRPAQTTILFMCTANSCRSVLSEALFNHLAAAPGRNSLSIFRWRRRVTRLMLSP